MYMDSFVEFQGLLSQLPINLMCNNLMCAHRMGGDLPIGYEGSDAL